MQITYIGHACILVEILGLRILMDPWLLGSSQVNGWWHVPTPTLSVGDLPPIDYVMISHIHEDHFHLPSLERLPKSATAVVPYSIDPWMGQALRQMGFARVIELAHGRLYRLRNGLQVRNFQRGRIDSAYWLRGDDESLLNLNDCPASSLWLRDWLRQYPSPTVALGAFSYASPYPVCYEIQGVDHQKTITESRRQVLEQFAQTMAILQPRYAIPFATQYGFLLPDHLWMNSHLPTPVQALEALAEKGCSKVKGVLLDPGDRLSTSEGVIPGGAAFDWKRRDVAVAEIAQARALEMQETLEKEPQPPESFFGQFQTYFNELLTHNRWMRERIGLPIAFVIYPSQERWEVDCSRRSDWVVRREADGRPPAPIEIHLPATVLYSAIQGQVHWENLYLSNRLRIKVSRDRLDREWNFWRMLFNFPQGILRDRLRFLSPRGIKVLGRRYPEILELVRQRLRTASQREPYRET